jgi:hypothetical protein
MEETYEDACRLKVGKKSKIHQRKKYNQNKTKTAIQAVEERKNHERWRRLYGAR